MFKKIAGIVFFFILACSTSAYALTNEQIKTHLEKYINITLADEIIKDCIEYNCQPPKSIAVLVSSYNRNECIAFLHIAGGVDPRVVPRIADKSAVEIALIVKRSGVSDEQMHANNFEVWVIPTTKKSNGQWIAYDATRLKWEGNNINHEWIDADFIQRNIIDR